MLRALPSVRYEFAERRNNVGVNIDYHVEYDKRYYSVHHLRVHQRVEVRATAAVIEIFHNNERIASHRRSYGPPGTAVTDPAHRPEHHRDMVWPPERLLSWSAKFGPAVTRVIELTLERYVNPEQGYRACLGVLRTAERYGATRMNAACERALAVRVPGGPRRKYIEAILKKGLDQQPHPPPATRGVAIDHENVRGAEYYERKDSLH